jgi:glycosyltransferase involved in cell wall biosynthesis
LASLHSLVILIPAFNPEPTLVDQVARLRELGFDSVIIVNDGSDAATQGVFLQLTGLPCCDVLHHPSNFGKGRALKTGLHYFLLHYPNHIGVVTVDADGQHRPEDTVRVAAELLRHPSQLVLGVRRLGASAPLRSLMGNHLTRWLYALAAGRALADTQCGLRGIPRNVVPDLLSLEGEHYDYEMQMLVRMQMLPLEIREVPIATIYIDSNRSSHFNPLLDSMRIYFVLVRFYASSLLASGLDLVSFVITYGLTSNLLLSLLLGRVLFVAMINFHINRLLVFRNRSAPLIPLLKYYLLVAALIPISYLCIGSLSKNLGWSVVVSKIVVETPLSVVSFLMQRNFVFKVAEDDGRH